MDPRFGHKKKISLTLRSVSLSGAGFRAVQLSAQSRFFWRVLVCHFANISEKTNLMTLPL